MRGVHRASLTVTEVRFDHPGYGLSDPVVPQDAYVFGVQLRAYPFHELWNDGKVLPVRQVLPRDTLIADLRTVEAVHTTVPFHSLQFFLPRSFLRELADDLEAPSIGDLRALPGVAVRDPILAAFAFKVRPALATPCEANDLWASHLMLAFGTYVAGTFGGMRTLRGVGGLNAWQRRAATEMIEAHLHGRITIRSLRQSVVCPSATSRTPSGVPSAWRRISGCKCAASNVPRRCCPAQPGRWPTLHWSAALPTRAISAACFTALSA